MGKYTGVKLKDNGYSYLLVQKSIAKIKSPSTAPLRKSILIRYLLYGSR